MLKNHSTSLRCNQEAFFFVISSVEPAARFFLLLMIQFIFPFFLFFFFRKGNDVRTQEEILVLVLQKQDNNGDKSTVYRLLRRDSFRLRCLNRWRANHLLSLLFFFFFYCCCLLLLLPCVLVLFRRFPLALFGSSSCGSKKGGKKALYGCEKRVIVFSFFLFFCLTPSYMLFADFITSQKSRENTRPLCNVSRFRENKVLYVCLCRHPSLTTRSFFFLFNFSPFSILSAFFF